MSTLHLADHARIELVLTHRAIKKLIPVSMDVIADYLILEHYEVLDVGATQALLWWRDQAPKCSFSITLSPRATRTLAALASALHDSSLTEAIACYILTENLPTLRQAPELFPGLKIRVPIAHEGHRDHPINVWVRDFAYKRYVEELQRVSCQGCDADEAIYQVFRAMTVADLAALVGTDLWHTYLLECQRVHGAEQTIRKLVHCSADFKASLQDAAKIACTRTLTLASYLLWNEVRGARVQSAAKGPIGLEALLCQTFGVPE